MTVQLSIRVEETFRDRLRRAAADEDQTLQAFVQSVLSDALEQRRATESARLHAVRSRLGAVVEAGAYDDYVASIDDPDLRTE